jgi:hypothetical protein
VLCFSLPVVCSVCFSLPVVCSVCFLLPVVCSVCFSLPVVCSVCFLLPVVCSVCFLLPMAARGVRCACSFPAESLGVRGLIMLAALALLSNKPLSLSLS